MDRLQHDIRIALRGFRRTPSFTITAILILAVGIGIAVAMFTVYGVVHWGAPGAPLLDGDRPLVINRTTVTGSFFDVLGAGPLLGRFLQPNDEAPGAAPVLVISYGTWMKDFGGDPAIVGHRLLEPYIGHALGMAGTGVVAGLIVALAGARLLSALLFQVSPTDPPSIAVSVLVLLFVAVVAAYIPARRATQIDPVDALRSD